jgi:hypothetical protein
MLMGDEAAERQITCLTEDTIILTDIFHIGAVTVEKQKVVHLYPDRLRWISTHLTGPNKYSQFIYEISAEGDGASRLDFTALHLEYAKLEDESVKSLAAQLRREDSGAWQLLAEAMVQDLGDVHGDKEKP